MSAPSSTLGLVRHALTFAGGILVSMGVADVAQVGQLVSDLITLTGAAISIIGVVGSILNALKQKRQLAAAQAAPALPFSMEKA